MTAARWLALADEAATLQLGGGLAHGLRQVMDPARAGDPSQPIVAYLHGDLGAGKTTLARGILRALGEQGPVRSPTYALLAEYDAGGVRVLHLDLYRLTAPDELQPLGLADELAGSHLWLIEWPERAQGQGLPAADVHIWIEPQEAARRLRLDAVSPRGEEWLRAAQEAA